MLILLVKNSLAFIIVFLCCNTLEFTMFNCVVGIVAEEETHSSSKTHCGSNRDNLNILPAVFHVM